MKLLDQIIEDLSDDKSSLNKALLKVQILAHKLRNKELTEWVKLELHGYRDNPPSYRKVIGQVKGSISNGYRKANNYPIPLMHLSKKIQEGFKYVCLHHGIATLEDLIKPESNSISVDIPPEIYGEFSKGLDGYYVEYAYVQIGQSQLVQVVTSIRSKLLDFILNLSDEIGNDDDINSVDNKKVNYLFESIVINGSHNIFTVGNQNTQEVSSFSGGTDLLNMIKNLLK